MEYKTKRAKYFTQNDKMRLVELITSSRVLLSKSTGGPNFLMTSKLKEAAWNQILLDYNSGSSSQRSLMALKKAWDNLKRDARTQRATIRCHVYGTGGGPSHDIEDPVLLKVEAAIGLSSSGLENPCDSNASAVQDLQEAMQPTLQPESAETEEWTLDENLAFTLVESPEMSALVPPFIPETPVMSTPAVPPVIHETPGMPASFIPPSVPRKAFKRRLCLKKSTKDSLFSDLQTVTAAKLEAERVRKEDTRNMEVMTLAQVQMQADMFKAQKDLFITQREMLNEERVVKAAESELRMDILKEELNILRLKRKAQEITLKKLLSECP